MFWTGEGAWQLAVSTAAEAQGYQLHLLDHDICKCYITVVLKVEYTKEALDQLAKAPPQIRRLIVKKIEALTADPFSRNNNVKALVGYDAYRLRVGDWRVIYAIRAQIMLLLVVRIARRDKVYE